MTVFATVGLVSCGGDEEKEEAKKMSVCDCMEVSEKMMKEAGDVDDDKLKEKYKEEIEECEKMFEDASPEEQKKMMEKAKDC